jgi:hypothetical protein
MECRFTLDFRGTARAMEQALDLFGCEDMRPDDANAPATRQFLDACARHGRKRGSAAGQALIATLSSRREGWRVRFRGINDAGAHFEAQYGSNGEDIAWALARFVADFPVAFDAVIEGDYDEDPHGFRFLVRDGAVSREHGFLAAGTLLEPDDPPAHAATIEALVAKVSSSTAEEVDLGVLSHAEARAVAHALDALQPVRECSPAGQHVFDHCERHGIVVSPGFRKKAVRGFRYAYVHTDSTPPRLSAVVGDSHMEICEYLLTRLGEFSPCPLQVLDAREGVVLDPVVDIVALQAALAAAGVAEPLPMPVRRYLDVPAPTIWPCVQLRQAN